MRAIHTPYAGVWRLAAIKVSGVALLAGTGHKHVRFWTLMDALRPLCNAQANGSGFANADKITVEANRNHGMDLFEERRQS